mmetsp:Transcript_11482/g.36021  ORF Transcript_11482/g.36021 Transcript_11482/m.36021 type:complete len:298 (-) Transcript_11482:7-900(-)
MALSLASAPSSASRNWRSRSDASRMSWRCASSSFQRACSAAAASSVSSETMRSAARRSAPESTPARRASARSARQAAALAVSICRHSRFPASRAARSISWAWASRSSSRTSFAVSSTSLTRSAAAWERHCRNCDSAALARSRAASARCHSWSSRSPLPGPSRCGGGASSGLSRCALSSSSRSRLQRSAAAALRARHVLRAAASPPAPAAVARRRAGGGRPGAGWAVALQLRAQCLSMYAALARHSPPAAHSRQCGLRSSPADACTRMPLDKAQAADLHPARGAWRRLWRGRLMAEPS